MTVHPDPVGDGIIASLALPGGNVTGLSDLHTVIATKRAKALGLTIPQSLLQRADQVIE
jgi:ABC-type uncharacterized transport system substrate-binding protein